MVNEEAREELSAALDWVVGYLESAGSHPVFSNVKPGEISSALPDDPPEEPESMEAIIGDIDRLILPGITHWNHPRFFGYFANTSPSPAIAGELISSALNANAMLWRTSPAATELEAVATRWMAKLIGLPDWFGIINDTASTSTLYALVAARNSADPDIGTRGVSGSSPMAVYASHQAHSSIDKAVMAIGLGTDALRKVPSDGEFRIDVGLLADAMESDLTDGIKPAAVVATVGTTATTSVDPISPIADLCERFGAWLHVDAAYAGVAGALPEFRWIWRGVERADSVVVNPHKWLFVPIDCSVLFLREPEKTRAAFSIIPEYLRSRETHNLMDYGISLGRRFRSLKLWMVMRRMGAARIRDAIREHVRLGHLLATWIEHSADFEMLAPVPFSVVNFRYAPSGSQSSKLNDINEQIVERVNSSGKAFVTTAPLRGKVAIHVAIGNLWTTEEDVKVLWELIQSAASSA